MRDISSATAAPTAVISAFPARGPGASRAGFGWGFLGVLAFSLTVPFTRVAVAQMSPLFVGAGRAVVAGICATAVLVLTRQRRPDRRQLVRLCGVAVGVVAGFPMLTSFALQAAPAAHGAVVIGLLPAATAVMAVWRGKERPSVIFWMAAGAGALAVLAFVALGSDGLGGLHLSDVLLLAAVGLAAFGYAEGAMLAREIGSWQVICWALVLALPVMTVLLGIDLARAPVSAGASAWWAFGYVSLFSMFLGFFAWYRGLAIGPIATVGQIQLVQPVLTIVWAALLLGEQLTIGTWVGASAVIVCAGAAVRARVRPPPVAAVR